MNQEAKRLFLAMFLTFGFLFVWSKYFAPQPAPVTTQAVAPTATPTQSAASTPTTTSNSSTTPQTAAKQPTTKIETYSATSKDLDVQYSNQSGTISSLELSHYVKTLQKDSEHVSVVPLAQQAPAPLLWNLSFRTSPGVEPKATLHDQNTFYAFDQKTPEQVSLSTPVTPALKVSKIYRFTKDLYVIEQTVHIENHSADTYYVDADTSIASGHEPKTEKKGFLPMQPQAQDVMAVAYARDEAFHWKLNNLADKKSQMSDSAITWSGFSSQYFLLTAIPTEGMWNNLKSNIENDIGTMTMGYPQRTLAPNSSLEYKVKLYAGPKKIEVLEAVHPTLNQSVDLGSWIGGLARTIHKLLGWIYGYIPNYGWAIIILTVIVRLAVFPLAQMQARSMKRMTQHKPAMDALKQKYANDKEAYSRELMSYMRLNKINPASGCLPLLIQFPVFIALYRVLYNSIELRQAPFMLWIHDLSAHDPFFVLPVLVGITFFLQTKLNPTPMADPAQQTMMKIMPVMFSVFMIFLPSGLNLYIFVSTLWGIVQQYMVQKSLN